MVRGAQRECGSDGHLVMVTKRREPGGGGGASGDRGRVVSPHDRGLQRTVAGLRWVGCSSIAESGKTIFSSDELRKPSGKAHFTSLQRFVRR